MQPQIIALTVLSAFATVLIAGQLASAVRNSDSWVIVRGLARGRYAQLRQSLRRDHRD